MSCYGLAMGRVGRYFEFPAQEHLLDVHERFFVFVHLRVIESGRGSVAKAFVPREPRSTVPWLCHASGRSRAGGPCTGLRTPGCETVPRV